MNWKQTIAGLALGLGMALPGVAAGQTLTVLRTVDSFSYDPQRATAAAASSGDLALVACMVGIMAISSPIPSVSTPAPTTGPVSSEPS